jgi:hypothetical protein
MTNQEFKTWVQKFASAFPDWRNWLDAMTSDGRSAILKVWATAFSDVDLIDAESVTTRMVAGDDPAIKAYERETTAAHVRKLAFEQRARRREATAHHDPTELPPKRGGQPMLGLIFRDVLAAMAAGEDSYAASDRLFPAVDDRRGPRYSCHKCQDSGYVTIWSPISIQAVVRGEALTRQNLRTCSTLCDCSIGESKVTPNTKRQRWTVDHVYDPRRHCLCPHGEVNRPERIRDLRAFVSLLREATVASMPNYSPTLALWNNTTEHGAGAIT